jgi:hypothetical protein
MVIKKTAILFDLAKISIAEQTLCCFSQASMPTDVSIIDVKIEN